VATDKDMKIRFFFKNPTIFWLLAAGVYCRNMVILEFYFGNVAIFLGPFFFKNILCSGPNPVFCVAKW
jgi:hypothetical protein